MPSLRELQQDFAGYLYDNTPTDFPVQIQSKGIDSAARLGIYRNNTFSGLSKALAAAYPVTERLVGADFFRYTAHEFIRAYPSRSGDLAEYGNEFPCFLNSFEPCRALVYLPDVARLEQAFNQAYRSAEHAPLALEKLAAISPEQYGLLQFRLHPSARLLKSNYPIARIWDINQSDYNGEETVDLTSGGCNLLVYRPQLAVTIQPLMAGEYTLLSALAAGVSFADACEQALSAENCPGNDITAETIATVFQHHVAQATLVDFVL
jgi:hypothetical protein